MKVSHYSYSSHSTYLLCPKKFELSKLYPEIRLPDNQYIEFGSKYHNEVEKYHNNLLHDAGLISEYTKLYPPNFYKAVEYTLKVKLKHPDTKEEIPVPLKLRIDGVNDDGLWDLKTTGSDIPQSTLNNSNQATLYCYAWKLLFGEIPIFNYIIYSRRNGTIREKRTYRSDNNFREAFDEMKDFHEKVEADEFPRKLGRHCLQCQFFDNGMCMPPALQLTVRNRYEKTFPKGNA